MYKNTYPYRYIAILSRVCAAFFIHHVRVLLHMTSVYLVIVRDILNARLYCGRGLVYRYGRQSNTRTVRERKKNHSTIATFPHLNRPAINRSYRVILYYYALVHYNSVSGISYVYYRTYDQRSNSGRGVSRQMLCCVFLSFSSASPRYNCYSV